MKLRSAVVLLITGTSLAITTVRISPFVLQGSDTGAAPPTGQWIRLPATAKPEGWQRVCVETTTIGITSLQPKPGLSIGGIPIGPSPGVRVQEDSTTVCKRHAWQCPAGQSCDPAKKPRI